MCVHFLKKSNDGSFQKNISLQYIPILSPLRQYGYGTTDPSNWATYYCSSVKHWIEFADTAHIQDSESKQ